MEEEPGRPHVGGAPQAPCTQQLEEGLWPGKALTVDNLS